MYSKFYQSATYPGVQEYVIDEDTPPVEATPSGGGTPRPAMSEAEVASERERENNKLSNTIHESPFVHHHVNTAHATHLLTLKKSSPQLFSHLKMKPQDFFFASRPKFDQSPMPYTQTSHPNSSDAGAPLN